MGWKFYDEAIDMIQRRFGYFPRLFSWRGRCYEVDSVDRCWDVQRRGKRPPRRFFQVQAADGVFELYRDLEAGTWHIRRAKLLPAAAPAVRAIIPVRAWQ
jgi:hypothetical protein